MKIIDNNKSDLEYDQSIVITPVVDVNATYSRVYPCDSKSVIRKFVASENFTDQITCFGSILITGNSSYDAIIGKQGGFEKNITLLLTNYTFFQTYVNG